MELQFLGPILEMLAGKYGVLAQIISIMGVARMVMKPVMVAAQEVVKVTPTLDDDAFMAKLMEHKVYKAIVFGLDYALSIKLPKKE